MLTISTGNQDMQVEICGSGSSGKTHSRQAADRIEDGQDEKNRVNIAEDGELGEGQSD